MGVIRNIRNSNVKMSALHYFGKNDTREQGFMLNAHQEQALLNTLLADLYRRLYGLRNARDVWQPETRGVSGKNMVMPFN